jgi:hypothetical protein
MNFRWLWFDHFPPDLKLTAAERYKAKRLSIEFWARDPNAFGGKRFHHMITIPAFIVGMLAMFFAIHTKMPWPFGWFATIFYPSLAWANYRSRRHFVRKALNVLGHPVCILCGYLLFGLDDQIQRCPECGTPCEPMPENWP